MVVRFVSNDKINICQPWTNDKVKLKAAFDNLFIEGGQSAVRDAIELTARQLLDEAKTQPEKEYALVLISDGSDRNSYYNDKQLFSLIGGTQIQVFAFGLTNELKDFGNSSEKETAERFLHALAERTGGTVYTPGKKHTADDLKAAVISLINELRSGFFIDYVPNDRNHGADARKIRVEIADGPNGEKRTVVLRNSFVLPKS